MKVKVRGWSLLESVVVMALLATILLALSQTLGPTLRLANRETDRGNAHGRLMLVMDSLENVLQRSCPEGIAWQPGSPALLAVHTRSDGQFSGGPRWDPAWTCFVWQSQKLWQRSSPPYPAVAPPPSDRPMAPGGPQLALLLTTPSSQSHLLSRDISAFEFTMSPGPIANLKIEIAVQVQGRTSPDKFQFQRHLYLRN